MLVPSSSRSTVERVAIGIVVVVHFRYQKLVLNVVALQLVGFLLGDKLHSDAGLDICAPLAAFLRFAFLREEVLEVNA